MLKYKVHHKNIHILIFDLKKHENDSSMFVIIVLYNKTEALMNEIYFVHLFQNYRKIKFPNMNVRTHHHQVC